MFNPFAVYVADVGDAQPANPSFYTNPGISVSPLIEYVDAQGYNVCSGILYTMRRDPQTFKLTVSFEIKETTINTMQLVYGGAIDSDGTQLTWEGTPPPYKAFWLQTCFNDDSKVVRITIPKGRSVETAEFSTGDAHVVLPTTIEALPEIDDTSTLPTIYFEA